MTRVSYDIYYNAHKVQNVVGYQEACQIVEELGSKCTFKPVYTEFDANDTPERREANRKHAEKIRQAEIEKALKHAPSYINASGVGAT